MALKKGVDVKPAKGKLGILLPGMGAVATTFIAGVQAIRRGIGKPIGSLTQLGHIRIGKRTDDHSPSIKDYVSLAKLDDIVFGGWDIFPDNAYQAAVRAGVLDARHLDPLKEELEAIRPMTAVFEQAYVKNLTGPNVKKGTSKMHLAEQVMEDIKAFKATNHCDRLVAVWCGSTEVYRKPTEVHSSLDKFEAALRTSHDDIAPSQIYAYACLKMGVPYANGAPNLSVDTPALLELARQEGLPVAGKDFKTGQTLMKTILAPGFKARMLGLSGWYSTNILGNRDGEVLDDPESFKSKEVTKLGVIDQHLARRPHQLLPAARRQQRRLGQHRHLRVARLSDADQGQLPVPRLDPRGADRPRSRAVHGLRAARGHERDPGVAVVLLEVPDDARGPLPGARSLHPAHEAEEHAALHEG
jgi:myo-inositol-1-phosphate synthase